MKPLTSADNVTIMEDPSRKQDSPKSRETSGAAALTLTDIQDAELLHLPDIRVRNQKSENPAYSECNRLVSKPGDSEFNRLVSKPGDSEFNRLVSKPGDSEFNRLVSKPGDSEFNRLVSKPGDNGPNRLVSKPSPHTDQTSDIKIHESLHKTLDSGVDNHPEHTSNSLRCVLSRQISKSDELATTASVNTLSVPYGSPRLMTRRGHLSQPTLHDLHASKTFSRSQTQLHKLGTELLPEKFRPYTKSLSHREFSLEDKKCLLPDIVRNDTKRRPVKTISRSSSAVTILPPLSNTSTSHLSVSQPDMLSPCVSPSTTNSCTNLLARRLRVRDLWKRAFQKLRLAAPSQEDSDGEEDTWVVSTGDVLRPVYSRWEQRRDALAEPERMCMPQVLREQIQKDVRSRKRSVKRKMSKFLNVNLGLNLEEDLAA